jgi:non-specific serine/threonine protein kinase
MGLERAIEYALGPATPEKTTARRRRGDGSDGPLTLREREVARLVSRGLTNREIASVLVVSERTAEGHVQSILNKLSFTSRAQIAAWAVAQGASSA